MISLEELKTILELVLGYYALSIIAAAGQDTWNRLREEFKKRRWK